MPPDWKRIRQARPDLTDWVIHWTRRRHTISAFEVLREIILDGMLKPTFAPRLRRTVGNEAPTIAGPHAAVCFSEQPLASLLITSRELPDRCSRYAVAFDKLSLFHYGGRPVLYGDDQLLRNLNDEDKYLWVRYSPVPDWGMRYPIDWTHEREWRSRPRRYHLVQLGMTPTEGVPLVLPPPHGPPDHDKFFWPKILVRTLQDARDLVAWLRALPPPQPGVNGFVRFFREVAATLAVVPLDVVENKIAAGDARWSKLDSLPFEELSAVIQG